MALVAKVYDRTYTTLVRTLTLAEGIACRPLLSAAGVGGLTLPLTAPDHAATLALEQSACAFRNIVRFEDGGSPVFAMVIRSKSVTRVDPGEEAQQGIDVDGVGTLALWSKAVWYPEIGVESDGVGLPIPYDTRHLTFAAADFDDSGWAAVTAVDISTAEQGAPTDWPDSTAKKIRPGGSPTVDRDPEVFGVRSTFTTSGGDLMLRLFYTADDGLAVWIDGVLVVSQTRPRLWQGTQYIDVRLRDGTHTWAIQGTNIDFPGLNYSWVLASLWTLSQGIDGIELGSLVANTNSGDWVGAQFGDTPPGFTPGAQIRIFMEEAQARGALEGWTLGFTDDVDSDGAAWPVAPASSYQVGLDGLSFLEQLGEGYADIQADYSALVLDAWVFGTKGGPSGITATPGTNVARLVNEATG
jgi:hypothetical protein